MSHGQPEMIHRSPFFLVHGEIQGHKGLFRRMRCRGDLVNSPRYIPLLSGGKQPYAVLHFLFDGLYYSHTTGLRFLLHIPCSGSVVYL